jgi:ribosomal protein S3AE
MIPYNSQNNNALIKELTFAVKSARESQNSAKIYSRANLLDKNRKSLNISKYTQTLIGQRISTNISNFSPHVVGGKPVQMTNVFI